MGRQSKSTNENDFAAAKTTEIAAIAGQKILFSKRGSMRLCSEVARSEK